MSKGKRDKRSRRRKLKVEDDPEAANDFLLSGQNDCDDGFVSSPTSSPEKNVRGRKRPKDSMAEELV